MERDVEDRQLEVFTMSLDFYIRLGLGQFSQIAQRLDLLCGERLTQKKKKRIQELCEEMEKVIWEDEKPWTLNDEDVSIHTLVAFLTEAQIGKKMKNVRWALKRISEKG